MSFSIMYYVVRRLRAAGYEGHYDIMAMGDDAMISGPDGVDLQALADTMTQYLTDIGMTYKFDPHPLGFASGILTRCLVNSQEAWVLMPNPKRIFNRWGWALASHAQCDPATYMATFAEGLWVTRALDEINGPLAELTMRQSKKRIPLNEFRYHWYDPELISGKWELRPIPGAFSEATKIGPDQIAILREAALHATPTDVPYDWGAL